ncbi:CDP-alcohol phosphatidyltransferase family protein [Luteolibacter marinus]|uniref:CDP-alcohol phosphatidyltransferase family protein n=1 Tax=Luteolibacter marinus TaxID=2776705 RepID=UPI0018692E44|nr:CDP-alcohol phosphatidyltransferase family protein [Luteolibacter marinus]
MKSRVTCYSGHEGKFMEWSQALRGRLLRPLLANLAGTGCRANHITALSLVSGLAFCPFFIAGQPAVALALLLFHVLLDGLDGPLARFRDDASNRGSFIDTMADQAVVTVTTLALIHGSQAGVWSGGLYLFLYTLVVGFALVRNAMALPYSWLFRPRFLVFAWIAVDTYLLPGSLDILLWMASLLLGAKAVSGFVKIGRKLT